MMRPNISNKLREIAAAIDRRGSSNLTRLTVLKKWFEVSSHLLRSLSQIRRQGRRQQPPRKQRSFFARRMKVLARRENRTDELRVPCPQTSAARFRVHSRNGAGVRISAIMTHVFEYPPHATRRSLPFEQALSRSSVLLVKRSGRSQAPCRYFNALGQLSPSQIGSKIDYSWPM